MGKKREKRTKIRVIKPKLNIKPKIKKQPGKKTKIKPKIKLIKQPLPVIVPSKKPDIKYEFNSVKKRLYDTGYSKNNVVKNIAEKQEEVYNPVLNKDSVDELIRKTKLNNNYQTDNYINPFLQEKFDVWKAFHRIDIQIRYAIDSYSAPRGI